MAHATLALETGQTVFVRLRASERWIESSIVRVQSETVELRFLRKPTGLAPDEFELGLDLEAMADGDRFSSPDLDVSRVDLEMGSLWLGPITGIPRLSRRIMDRVRIELPLRLALEGTPEEIHAQTVDLGCGGIGFRCEGRAELQRGAHLRFELSHEGQTTTGYGHLVWVSSDRSGVTRAGLRLESLEQKGLDLLSRLVAAAPSPDASAARVD